jgi:S1-C subfamily serine protease
LKENTLLYRSLKNLSLCVALIGVSYGAGAHAQAKAPKASTPTPDALTVESSSRQSTQVVTVVHRLNGIKALALLQRNGEAVTMVDEDIVTASNVVTSITAGFALGDGQSIVARLPQAEAEIEAATFFSTAPVFRPQMPGASRMPAPLAQRGSAVSNNPEALMPVESSGFIVVQSSGKQYAASYIGLDGLSGLSLLKLSGLNVPISHDAKEEQLAVGQSVRLFAPVRAVKGANATPSTVSLRVGEIEGKISEITRTSTGRIAYLTIKAPNLSSAIVGGIALNEAGEAVGIVETSNDGAARLIPAAVVRRAADRVLARQSSVPRPWLGVRGEAVTATPLEKFYVSGWTEPEAAALKGKQEGILLTSVAPGTPAALADLRAGDVIVRVNDFEVKNAEDFSFVLNEVGSNATVNFTLFRGPLPKPSAPSAPPAMTPMPMPPFPPFPAMSPEAFKFKPLVVPVKLSESLNTARAMKLAESYAFSFPGSESLPPIARGLETVTLSSKAATHLGARGGLLVVFVDPESASARSGIRVFDVIESVDGKLLGQTSWSAALPANNPQRLSLGIVRDRQKVEITIQQKDEQKK